MLTYQGISFINANAYFDYMAVELGRPKYHTYFKSDWVISDGFKLHVDVLEYEALAPTIVFIPGTAIYAMAYGELMCKLSESGYNVIGFDPRGHGRSEGIRGDYSIAEIISDARHVISYAIERFNKKVTVLGSSQGGIIALYLAALETRLDSVICQNFADLMAPEAVQLTRHPRLFKYIKMLLGKTGHLLPEMQIPVSTYIDLESIPVTYYGNAKNYIETDPLCLKSVTLRAVQSLGQTALARPVNEITTPVMVMQGSADSIFPVEYTRNIYNKLTAKKKFSLFEGLAHSMLHENVDEVLPEINAWLQEVYHINYRHQLS